MTIVDKLKKNKRAQIVAAAVIGLPISLIGGYKVLIYVVVAVLFFILGKKFEEFKRLYLDYKLGLKINAIQYSMKQMEQYQTEIKTLREELGSAKERLELHSMMGESIQKTL